VQTSSERRTSSKERELDLLQDFRTRGFLTKVALLPLSRLEASSGVVTDATTQR
jgi:hypothetical protein